MKYISENIDFNIKNSAVTLGKFDGLHQGHQILIDKVLSLKEEGYTSVMFTFLYHPYNLFSDNEIKLIFTEDEKKHILSQSGLDVLISYPFSHDTKNIEPEDFIKNILVEKLNAKLIVVGNDFRLAVTEGEILICLRLWKISMALKLYLLKKNDGKIPSLAVLL